MVTCYICNTIAFLSCHYAYLSQSLLQASYQHSIAIIISKKFICKVNSFAFNGNSFHVKRDCIFCTAITLICKSLLQANYQRSITIKYCTFVIAIQRSPAVFTRLLVFFGSCENKLHHYK